MIAWLRSVFYRLHLPRDRSQLFRLEGWWDKE